MMVLYLTHQTRSLEYHLNKIPSLLKFYIKVIATLLTIDNYYGENVVHNLLNRVHALNYIGLSGVSRYPLSNWRLELPT